jgi:hypothetical protein
MRGFYLRQRGSSRINLGVTTYVTLKWRRLASTLSSARPGDVTRPPARSTKAKYFYICGAIVERYNNYATFY